MSENIQPQQSEFVRSFDAMKAVVTNPDTSFVPFKDPLRPNMDTSPVHVPNYVVIEGKVVPMLSDDIRRMYSYERWETNRPDLTETFPSFDDLPEGDRRAWRTAPLLKGDSYEARHWLPAEWITYVKAAGDVAHVLKYVFDQNVQRRSGPHQGMTFAHIIQAAVALSLRYAGQPDASLMTDAIHQSLAEAPPEEREDFIERIYPPIGKALVRGQVNTYSAVLRIVGELSGEELVKGVEFYDRAGLISDKFWPSFGVVAMAAVKTPEFAPMLAGKLTGPDGDRLVQKRYLPYPYRSAAAYITEVFSAYAEDPNRNRAFANRVLDATTRPRKRAGTNVDLSALIGEANRLADGFNQGVDQRDGDPSEKFAILSDELTFASDAFLRLMGLTRRTDLPRAVQVAQWELDIHQAEVIGAVLGRGSETEISDADVALRFPGLDIRQRTFLRLLMRDKGGELLDALQKAQGEPPRDPSAEKQLGEE